MQLDDDVLLREEFGIKIEAEVFLAESEQGMSCEPIAMEVGRDRS